MGLYKVMGGRRTAPVYLVTDLYELFENSSELLLGFINLSVYLFICYGLLF